jgi:hypothetical protein
MNPDFKEQLDRIESKLDELLAILVKRKQIQTPEEIKAELKAKIEDLYAYYKLKINKRSRLIKKAEQKITARLKEYTADELKKAIDNFSQDEWWMKNNAHRGVAWFFHSEDRIEQFINLIPQKLPRKLELFHKDQPCKFFGNKLMIYAPWKSEWLAWNQDHPLYEDFKLCEDGRCIATGKEAFVKYRQGIKY